MLNKIIKSIRGKIFKSELYKEWENRKAGKEFKDFERGAGFYLPSFITSKNVGSIWETKMSSGKTAIYKCLSCEFYFDPDDMVKESWWQFLGYKDENLISETTYDEFVQIYGAGFKKK